MVHHIRGSEIPLPERVPDMTWSIGITAGWPQLRAESANPGSVLKGIYALTAPWRPRFLVSNFRSGPAAWLAWAGIGKGWDVRGVISRGQVEGSPGSHRLHIQELLEICPFEVVDTPEQRDARVREVADMVLDVGNIVMQRLPKMDHIHVRSPE